MKKDYNFQKGKKLIIKEKGRFHQVAIECISTISCENYVSKIETISKSNIHSCKSLNFFESELQDEGFCRVNRNTIINMNNIMTYQNNGKPFVEMSNNETINISRRKLSKFLEKINH